MPTTPLPWDVCELAYRATHDLQAQLLRIGSFAALVGTNADSVPGDQDLRCLEIISRSTREASVLVDRLLALTIAWHRPLRRCTVDILTTVQTVLAGLATEVASSDATVDLGELGSVDADPELLALLCRELLANAIAFHEPGRATHIALYMDYTDEGKPACLRVSDDGIGVPEARRSAILEPFESSPGADGVSGTGLGLVLCRIICERHGWTLDMRDLGKRTEVRILLGQGCKTNNN